MPGKVPRARGPSQRFLKLDAEVAERRDLRSSTKLVHAAIVDCMRAKNKSWPGVRHICSMTGLTDKTVTRAIREIEENELLKVRRRGRGRGHVYERILQVQSAGETPALATEKAPEELREGVGELPKEAPENLRPKQTNSRRKKQTRSSAPRKRGTETPRKPRKEDPVWDTFTELFGLNPITKTERSRVGRLTRDLKAKHATSAEVSRRAAAYQNRWPGERFWTPEAFLKHYDELVAKGNGKPPARHWISATIAEVRPEWGEQIDKALKALNRIGARVDAGELSRAQVVDVCKTAADLSTAIKEMQ